MVEAQLTGVCLVLTSLSSSFVAIQLKPALSVVKEIISHVVSSRLEEHRRLRWPHPELFYLCSDVCYAVRKSAREKRILSIEIKS